MTGRHPDKERAAASARARGLVPIAVVVGAHGVHGELRVKLYNPDSLLLEQRAQFARFEAEGEPSYVRVRDAREHARGLWRVTIEGCGDRDAALALRGTELWVPRAELPALPEGEHYLLDFVGLEARTTDGSTVGRVLEAIEYPASHVLRVASARGELEIPLAEPYVLDVRPEEGYVIVGDLEDLEPHRS